MPPENTQLPPNFADLAAAQGLDPAVIQQILAQQAGPAAPMDMNAFLPVSQSPVPVAQNPQDVIENSPLLMHADDMAPILQQATQDEVLAFIRKIVDLYLNVV